MSAKKKNKYNLLLKRIQREKELAIIEQKMQTQKNLLVRIWVKGYIFIKHGSSHALNVVQLVLSMDSKW